MKKRGYQLMVMDASGGRVKRTRLLYRTVAIAVGAAALLIFVNIAVIVHGLTLRAEVEEAAAVRQENRAMRQVLVEVEQGMPNLERLALRAEVSFGQLWSKSGLGVEPSLLAAGPIEGNDAAFVNESEIESTVNAADPLALGLEVSRIEENAAAARATLSDLLEYFNDARQMLSNTPSIRPARTPWITSSFGLRTDPMDGRKMMHKGLDIGGASGTPILAPADGVVIFVGQRGGYGRTVVLDHGYGYQTHFAHLSQPLVARGEKVSRGKIIAEMGSTGKSTGPHLHYEVRRYGRPIDPMRFVLD